MKKKIIRITGIIAMFILAVVLASCTEAEKVNYNISKQAEYFESERKITVYNARTDQIILEAEGYSERMGITMARCL